MHTGYKGRKHTDYIQGTKCTKATRAESTQTKYKAGPRHTRGGMGRGWPERGGRAAFGASPVALVTPAQHRAGCAKAGLGLRALSLVEPWWRLCGACLAGARRYQIGARSVPDRCQGPTLCSTRHKAYAETRRFPPGTRRYQVMPGDTRRYQEMPTLCSTSAGALRARQQADRAALVARG